MPKEITTLLTFFGATGDLAKRKLYPATYNLYKKGFLKNNFAIVGTSRSDINDEEFREIVKNSIGTDDSDEVNNFLSHIFYIKQDITDQSTYKNMKELNDKLDNVYSLKGNRIYYMSVAPRFFGVVAKYLKSEGLITENGEFNRLMVEKPFGTSYDTAKELQDTLLETTDEDHIFRIDHYLGKEMVQNISRIRFGNPLFESTWNKDYIDNIQITLSEVLGVEDRASYYETAGVLRDMLQNHIMQIIGWIAMEKPESFNDKEVREAKNKAFNALKIYSSEEIKNEFIRGQYIEDDLKTKKRYTDELDVPKDSHNNTYVAGKITFSNDRWDGVPFYIRSGKRLKTKSTRIDIVYKKNKNIFSENSEMGNDVLSIIIDPTAEIEFTINTKDNTSNTILQKNTLDWVVSKEKEQDTPKSYERILHDVLLGKQSNFADWKGLSIIWKFVDAIQEAWDNNDEELPKYKSGSMGPKEADQLLNKNNNYWIYK